MILKKDLKKEIRTLKQKIKSKNLEIKRLEQLNKMLVMETDKWEESYNNLFQLYHYYREVVITYEASQDKSQKQLEKIKATARKNNKLTKEEVEV